MNKKTKIFFILAFCLIFPCLFLSACDAKSENIDSDLKVETGFSVFYGEKDVSSLAQPLSFVKGQNYDVENLFSVFAIFSDGSKSRLIEKTETENGFEVSSTVPEESEIVVGQEYVITVSYKEYSSFEINVVFANPVLSAPVLAVSDTDETLSWQAVEHASCYKYRIKNDGAANFGEEKETTETSIDLTWGWTVQVQAVSESENYDSSAWVQMQEAWKPQREIAPDLVIENTNVVFTLDDNGDPVVFRPKLENFDDKKIKIEGLNLVINGTSSAGSYQIRYAIKDGNKYCWKEGLTSTKSKSWTIKQRTITLPTVTAVTDNGDGTYTITDTNTNDEARYYTYSVEKTSEGYTITFTLKYKNDTRWQTVTTEDYVYYFNEAASE